MSTRNTAIFDLDGTLLNSLQDLTNSVNYCMKKYGGPSYTCEEIREKVGNGIYVLIEYLCHRVAAIRTMMPA